MNSNTKTMIPKLRFPEFSGDWEVKSISDLGDVITGSTPPTQDRSFYGTEYDFITPGDMNSGRYVTATKAHLSKKGFLRSRQIIEKSTLFVCIGSTIGKVAQATKYSSTNQQINTIINNMDNDPDFVYLSLLRIAPKVSRLAGEQAVPMISKSEFSKIKLYTTNIEEQRKIAGFLGVVDDRIEAIDEKVELLKKYKKGVMQKIFTQQIRFKDENDNPYPDWEEKMLGDFATIKTGNLNVQDAKDNGKYTFFDRSEEIKKYDEYSFDNEAIIYAGEGSEFLPRYFNGKYGLHQRAYTVFDTSGVSIKFLYFYMLTQNWHFLRMAVGSTVKSLRMDCFSKCKIGIPTLKEQQKIVTLLTSLDDKIKVEETKLASAQKFKKALLQRMFV